MRFCRSTNAKSEPNSLRKYWIWSLFPNRFRWKHQAIRACQENNCCGIPYPAVIRFSPLPCQVQPWLSRPAYGWWPCAQTIAHLFSHQEYVLTNVQGGTSPYKTDGPHCCSVPLVTAGESNSIGDCLTSFRQFFFIKKNKAFLLKISLKAFSVSDWFIIFVLPN